MATSTYASYPWQEEIPAYDPWLNELLEHKERRTKWGIPVPKRFLEQYESERALRNLRK